MRVLLTGDTQVFDFNLFLSHRRTRKCTQINETTPTWQKCATQRMYLNMVSMHSVKDADSMETYYGSRDVNTMTKINCYYSCLIANVRVKKGSTTSWEPWAL